MSRNTSDGWYSEDKPVINAGWESNTYMGLIHNPEHPEKLPMAQVYVPELWGGMEVEERNGLPWMEVALGAGTGSGGESIGHILQVGQTVEVEQDTKDISVYRIIKKFPFYETAAASNAKPNPNSVTPLSLNEVNQKDNYINPTLLEQPLNALATTDISKLQGTVFSVFNQARTKFDMLGLADWGIPALPFDFPIGPITLPGLIELIEGEPSSGYVAPLLTIGVEGAIDLTKDFSRCVDTSGGNCGNISTMIQADGWKAKSKDWAFDNLNSTPVNISENGDIIIDQGVGLGIHIAQCRIVNKALAEVVEPLPDLAKEIIYELYDGSLCQSFDVACSVVNDLSKLDFSQSIDFIDSMIAPVVGPKFASENMPSTVFEMDPKITDKATFGQLHVVAGPGNLTPSTEQDFTTSTLKISSSNEKR